MQGPSTDTADTFGMGLENIRNRFRVSRERFIANHNVSLFRRDIDQQNISAVAINNPLIPRFNNRNSLTGEARERELIEIYNQATTLVNKSIAIWDKIAPYFVNSRTDSPLVVPPPVRMVAYQSLQRETILDISFVLHRYRTSPNVDAFQLAIAQNTVDQFIEDVNANLDVSGGPLALLPQETTLPFSMITFNYDPPFVGPSLAFIRRNVNIMWSNGIAIGGRVRGELERFEGLQTAAASNSPS